MSCSSIKESRSVMRSARESAQATYDRQDLLINVLRALSTPGLTGAGHNLLHQVQSGDKRNTFCCEQEVTESQKQHKTSCSTHSKPAPSSKQQRLFAPLPSETPSKPLNKVTSARDGHELPLGALDLLQALLLIVCGEPPLAPPPCPRLELVPPNAKLTSRV